MHMQLIEDSGSGKYKIQAYEQGWIKINETIIHNSVVITPEHLINPWQVTAIEAVQPHHFLPIFALNPSLVLIGTGKTLVWLAQEHTAAFYQKNIGIEIMDTHSACRTYTLLMAEGRTVAAALIV